MRFPVEAVCMCYIYISIASLKWFQNNVSYYLKSLHFFNSTNIFLELHTLNLNCRFCVELHVKKSSECMNRCRLGKNIDPNVKSTKMNRRKTHFMFIQLKWTMEKIGDSHASNKTFFTETSLYPHSSQNHQVSCESKEEYDNKKNRAVFLPYRLRCSH